MWVSELLICLVVFPLLGTLIALEIKIFDDNGKK